MTLKIISKNCFADHKKDGDTEEIVTSPANAIPNLLTQTKPI